ncbi:MAG TPA: hypothetical protein VF064_16955 [Pyrinomonadaceae bacterium]
MKNRSGEKMSEGLNANAARRARAGRTNSLVRFVVIGAFVFGVLPAPGGALLFAQPQKAGAKVNKAPRVNAAPLRAWLAQAKRQKDAGRLDLAGPRAVTIEADRAEDGTLSNAVITGPSARDPQMRKLAQDFVAALNQSRALGFLQDVSHVRMNFALDGERFKTDSASDAPTAQRAEEMARGYRAMVNVARLMRRGTDEAAVLNNMKFSSNGKQLLMSLDMPREQMGNLLLKQITPN